MVAVLKQALEAHYGSLKAAAMTLDVDQSQLNREIDRLARLDACDDDAKNRIGEAFFDAYANEDPKAKLRREIREIRRRCDRLDELITR